MGRTSLRAGQLLAERYQCVEGQIFLDTQPGSPPGPPMGEIYVAYLPYLKLSPYQLHIPQIYAILSPQQTRLDTDILLLEQAAIALPCLEQTPQQPQLLPTLSQVWPTASELRQLNWLRQIASLWQPLEQEHVASSLLIPDLLRVDSATLRLLELQSDSSRSHGSAPPLKQLGQLWLSWTETAQAGLVSILQPLCQRIIQGQIHTAEQVVAELDQQLAQRGRSQTRQIQIATLTDQGPTRQRNEDACFPPSGTAQALQLTPERTPPDAPESLVIVCDGIGGHEGGNVASNLAIETVQQHLQSLLNQIHHSPAETNPAVISTELELAICAANDAISQRNDQERRQERQRMGTTLVMALAQAHELYIAHLGDSRAYRITRQECRQITLDDDVAAREVRLGYTLYREAVQHPGSGSLVQALGMGASSYLYPSVQHFVLDEDCLFLLCSDGLSDNDLVDAFWRTELLPVLDGQYDLQTASQRLVEIANTHNGYDNVTVGLLHCRVYDPAADKSFATRIPSLTTKLQGTSPAGPSTSGGTRTVQLAPVAKPRSPSLGSLLLGILILLGLGGVLAYLLFPGVGQRVDQLLGQDAPPPLDVLPSGDTSPQPTVSPRTDLPLVAGQFVQVPQPQSGGEPRELILQRQPGLSANAPSPNSNLGDPSSAEAAPATGLAPVGSMLKVLATRQESPDQPRWVQLQVCTVPQDETLTLSQSTSGANASEITGENTTVDVDAVPIAESVPAIATLQPGEIGWISEEHIRSLVQVESSLDPSEIGGCAGS